MKIENASNAPGGALTPDLAQGVSVAAWSGGHQVYPTRQTSDRARSGASTKGDPQRTGQSQGLSEKDVREGKAGTRRLEPPASTVLDVFAFRSHPLAAGDDDEHDDDKQNRCDDTDRGWTHRSTLLE